MSMKEQTRDQYSIANKYRDPDSIYVEEQQFPERPETAPAASRRRLVQDGGRMALKCARRSHTAGRLVSAAIVAIVYLWWHQRCAEPSRQKHPLTDEPVDWAQTRSPRNTRPRQRLRRCPGRTGSGWSRGRRPRRGRRWRSTLQATPGARASQPGRGSVPSLFLELDSALPARRLFCPDEVLPPESFPAGGCLHRCLRRS